MRNSKLKNKYHKNRKTKKIKYNSYSKINLRGGGVIDLSVIKKIEGPVYVGFLTPKINITKILGYYAPQILLLGDIHEGDNKCKPDCKIENNCYSLYKDNDFTLLTYLDKQATKQNLKIDLFLEEWVDKERLNINIPFKTIYSSENDSALSNLEETVKHCHPDNISKNKCKYKNIRVHMSDPRNTEIQKHTIILELLNKSENYSDFEVLCNNYFPMFYPEYILNLCKKYFRKQSYTFNEFIEEPFYIFYNISLKQFKKLPIKLQNIISNECRTIDDYIPNLHRLDISELDLSQHITGDIFINNYHKKITDLIDINENDSDKSKKEKDSNKFWKKYIDMHIKIFITDLYTISRLLKKPISKSSKNALISSLSLVYMGNKHIKNIKQILIQIYEIVNENETIINDNNALNNNKNLIKDIVISKCIDINI